MAKRQRPSTPDQLREIDRMYRKRQALPQELQSHAEARRMWWPGFAVAALVEHGEPVEIPRTETSDFGYDGLELWVERSTVAFSCASILLGMNVSPGNPHHVAEYLPGRRGIMTYRDLDHEVTSQAAIPIDDGLYTLDETRNEYVFRKLTQDENTLTRELLGAALDASGIVLAGDARSITQEPKIERAAAIVTNPGSNGAA